MADVPKTDGPKGPAGSNPAGSSNSMQVFNVLEKAVSTYDKRLAKTETEIPISRTPTLQTSETK